MKVLAAYLFIFIAYVVVNSSLGIEVAQCPNNGEFIFIYLLPNAIKNFHDYR